MTLHFFSAAFRPYDEVARQRAVDALPPIPADDAELQFILEEVRAVLGTPMAMLTIIDHEVQHMPIAIGVQPMTVSRAMAFCPHTMAEPDGVLCVPDLRADSRFSANPMVSGPMGIRYYAGASVMNGLDRVGALCGIDTRPGGPLSSAKRSTLGRLAQAVAAHIGAASRRLD